MWFTDVRAVSDGINCYPVSTPTNNYNNWGPIRDLEVILQLPNNRAILATYQLSTEMSSAGHAITGLSADGFYQQTSPLIRVMTYIWISMVLWSIITGGEYIILMCCTGHQRHSPLLIVNMTTEIIRTYMP